MTCNQISAEEIFNFNHRHVYFDFHSILWTLIIFSKTRIAYSQANVRVSSFNNNQDLSLPGVWGALRISGGSISDGTEGNSDGDYHVFGQTVKLLFCLLQHILK